MNHAAIGRDECDAGSEQLADPTRLGVERARRRWLRVLTQELGGKARFRHECLIDASCGLRAH